MCVEAFILISRYKINLYPLSAEQCTYFDSANSPTADLLWMFYTSKILDFVDTFFIIVGGKMEQFSFLHVYHHFTIFIMYFIAVNLAYDGGVIITVVMNAFVHTIMYSYYLIRLHADHVWWKKYLTLTQIGQFLVMMSSILLNLYHYCGSPPRVLALCFFYLFSLVVLFSRFYASRYGKKLEDRKTKTKTGKKNQ